MCLEVVTDATYLLGHRVRVRNGSGGIVSSGVDGVLWQPHNKSFEFVVVQTGAYFGFSGNSVFFHCFMNFLMQGLSHSLFPDGPQSPHRSPIHCITSSEIGLLHQQSQGPIEATPLEDL